MHGLFLSALNKSSGKTTVAVGLVAALTERGTTVQPGPGPGAGKTLSTVKNETKRPERDLQKSQILII